MQISKLPRRLYTEEFKVEAPGCPNLLAAITRRADQVYQFRR